MYLGKRIIIKHEGKIQEGSIHKIFEEDLEIMLDGGIIVTRKFWEIGCPKNEEKN